MTMLWSYPQGVLFELFDNPYVRTILADGTVRSGKTTALMGRVSGMVRA